MKLKITTAVAALLAFAAHAVDSVVVQSAENGYNAWPIVQAIGEKVVCAYSRGMTHGIHESGRGVFARVSADGGVTWGEEVTVANESAYGEVAIGKGLDANGAMLLWVRCCQTAWTPHHHDLYRTMDGVTFEKIATPALDPVPMQMTDIFAVPGVGLMCLWFSDGYQASSVRAWGKLVSADNGLTWTQTTIETNLTMEDWPTEPSGVWLDDGKILVIARSEEGVYHQFQITSTDSGATWTKRQSNITDVNKSTPSLVLDSATGLVSNYYYDRSAKQLKRRVAVAADIFDAPGQWPSPSILYAGGGTDDKDAGNVNVTVLADGRHLAAIYTGTSSNTKIIAMVVPAPATSWIVPSARNYSQRGLVLQLDGRENAGAGLAFDPEATEWKDLSPSGNDAILTPGGDFAEGEFGLQMKIPSTVASGAYYAAVTKGNVTAGMTGECLVKPTGGDSSQTTAVWGGGGNSGGLNGDHIPLPRARYNSGFCFDTTSKKWLTVSKLEGKAYQFALRSTDNTTWTAYNDGVSSNVSDAPGAKIKQAPMALGGFYNYPRRMTGTLYAVRCYDRTLREEELKANAILDHVRFEGADPAVAAWPEGFRYDPIMGELQVRVKVPAQAGLLFLIDEGEPVSSIDAWVARGKTYKVTAVGQETAGATFLAWADSAGELTEEESELAQLELIADFPRQLVASADLAVAMEFSSKAADYTSISFGITAILKNESAADKCTVTAAVSADGVTYGEPQTLISDLGANETKTGKVDGLIPSSTYYFRFVIADQHGHSSIYEETYATEMLGGAGGDREEAALDGSGERVHYFTTPSVTQLFTAKDAPLMIEYLVVGGGGGSASDPYSSGGGGGGGVLAGSVMVAANSKFLVTVGAGGIKANPGGTSSVVLTDDGVTPGEVLFEALGGGCGGLRNTKGGDGANGGGAGGNDGTCAAGGLSNWYAEDGQTPRGFPGGKAAPTKTGGYMTAGGGGGAGGPGGDGQDGLIGGDGGAGIWSDITGENLDYGGGGGGTCAYSSAGTGGVGHGGGGSGGKKNNDYGINALPNRGGGAQGCKGGADGGSGVVIFRYFPAGHPAVAAVSELEKGPGFIRANIQVLACGDGDEAVDVYVACGPEGGESGEYTLVKSGVAAGEAVEHLAIGLEAEAGCAYSVKMVGSDTGAVDYSVGTLTTDAAIESAVPTLADAAVAIPDAEKGTMEASAFVAWGGEKSAKCELVLKYGKVSGTYTKERVISSAGIGTIRGTGLIRAGDWYAVLVARSSAGDSAPSEEFTLHSKRELKGIAIFMK